MFPSSSRVKLNRVALKDVVGLKLTPRRRRLPKLLDRISADSKNQEKNFDSVQQMSEKDTVSPPGSNEPDQNFTHTMGSERKTQAPSTHDEEEPEENGSGTQKTKSKVDSESRRADKHDGPNTRGKYQQSKRGVAGFRNMCNLRPRFIWCVCKRSYSAWFIRLHGRTKPRSERSKIPYQMKLTSQAVLAMRKGRKRQADLKSGRCHFRQCDIRGESGVARRTKSVRVGVREGRSSVKATSAGCDPQPAAPSAKSGQVRRETPRRLPSKVHFSWIIS